VLVLGTACRPTIASTTSRLDLTVAGSDSVRPRTSAGAEERKQDAHVVQTRVRRRLLEVSYPCQTLFLASGTRHSTDGPSACVHHHQTHLTKVAEGIHGIGGSPHTFNSVSDFLFSVCALQAVQGRGRLLHSQYSVRRRCPLMTALCVSWIH
jgi:hypothetical protein